LEEKKGLKKSKDGSVAAIYKVFRTRIVVGAVFAPNVIQF